MQREVESRKMEQSWIWKGHILRNAHAKFATLPVIPHKWQYAKGLCLAFFLAREFEFDKPLIIYISCDINEFSLKRLNELSTKRLNI